MGRARVHTGIGALNRPPEPVRWADTAASLVAPGDRPHSPPTYALKAIRPH